MHAVLLTLCAGALGADQPPVVESIDADSRGRIVITVDRVLNAATVNANSVVVASPGPDDRIGTDDDVEVDAEVVFNFANLEIRVFADVDPGRPYAVRLDAGVIQSADGCFLDGEFTPGSPSGDGVEGGDFIAFAKFPAGNPTVRFTTIEGDIEAEFFEDQAPLTVQNFFDYMNDGVYDESFFHRSVEGFVIQGGGFFADDDLSGIPTNPPVMNEPGLSNARGTIAMAKMANNPNSATNQFFFNLANNTSLDDQNGGFTVFGEITTAAGLDVMDAIAAFETVDASDQGSAFGELPVLDADAVVDDEGVVAVEPDDLIAITRVAGLYELTDDPFEELSPGQTTTIASGGAAVNLIGINGPPPAEASVSVKFGKGGDIKRITLLDTSPNAPMGLQITGAAKVGSITDKRASGQAGLAFIVSEAPVGAIKLREGPSGFPLNNVLLPDGAFLDPDLDADGETDDEVAIFIEQGFVKSIAIQGDLAGDVVIPGGAGSITVKGRADDADIVLGDPGGKSPKLKVRMGDVRRSSLIAEGAFITSFRADSWTESASEMITADGLASLRIDGDFDASFTIPPVNDAPAPLKSIKIDGDASGVWTFRGDCGPVSIGGDCVNLTFAALGEMASFKAGDMQEANIGAFGRLGAIAVGDWDGGVLDVRELGAASIKGDYDADLNIQGGPSVFDVMSFNVQGGADGGVLFIGGGVKSFQIAGPVSDAQITVQTRADLINLGPVSNSSINAGGDLGVVRADRWIGGFINAPSAEHIHITGAGQTPGDLDADLNVTDLTQLTLANGGELDGELVAVVVGGVHVGGDVNGAVLRIGNSFTRGVVVLEDLFVGGDVINSEIEANGIVIDVRADAMIGSHLIVGGPAGLDEFPDGPGQIDPLGRLSFIDIAPTQGGSDGFVDSYVIAGVIGEATIGGLDPSNASPFGVGAFQIDQLWLTGAGGFRVFQDPAATPEPVEDFELRIGFEPANP